MVSSPNLLVLVLISYYIVSHLDKIHIDILPGPYSRLCAVGPLFCTIKIHPISGYKRSWHLHSIYAMRLYVYILL